MDDIFEILLSGQFISISTAQAVRKFCQKWQISGYLGLLETNVFDEVFLADTLAQLLQVDRVYAILVADSASESRERLTYEYAMRWECFPSFANEQVVELVIADPTQPEILELLEKQLGTPVKLAIGTRSEVLKAIRDHYPVPL